MNDNQPFTNNKQLVDWLCQAGDYNSWRELHPHLKDRPDYGLILKPEDEVGFRARAQSYGMDYEKIKQQFIWSHQVIPFSPRDDSQELMMRRAIPINSLKNYFDQYISISIRCELRSRERQRK